MPDLERPYRALGISGRADLFLLATAFDPGMDLWGVRVMIFAKRRWRLTAFTVICSRASSSWPAILRWRALG